MDLDNLTGPYKATKLWNHAVSLFCNEMPVHRHRRRMKYYDDCFTGAQAISWFHKVLIDSPCFDQEVTKKQTQQLLGKFLKAGVFHSIKGSTQFKKNSLYEFLKENVSATCHANEMHTMERPMNQKEKLKTNTLKKNLPLQSLDENKKKFCATAKGPQCINSEAEFKYRLSRRIPASEVLLPEDIWKKNVIERIQELLPGEEIVSKLPEFINPKWVLINGSPEYSVIRKRMFLPNWVATAIRNVLYPEGINPQNSYPSFTEDVVNTVYDYFNCLSLPLIPVEFYDIIIHIFLHLMKIDENTKKKMYLNVPFNSKSMENLLLDMSSPKRQISISKLNCTLLPANSCFETAFTSDIPITRIVPQSSVDTVYLARKTFHHRNLNSLSTVGSQHNLHKSEPSRLIRRSRSTAQNIQNACKKYIPISRSKSVRKVGSSLFVEHKKLNSLSSSNSRSDVENGKWPNPKTDGGFVNFGLSKSLDDLNSENIHELDLIQALDSLQILVDATKSHSEKYYSDISLSSNNSDEDTSSNAESDSSSDEPISIRHRGMKYYSRPSMPRRECFRGTNLLQPTLCLADSIYLLIFTLMPPECRSTVSLVLKFLHHLYKHSQSSRQIFLHFSNKILRPATMTNSNSDQNLSKRILYFLMERNENIFTDLPKEFISYIDSQVASVYEKQNSQENNLCKQTAISSDVEEPVKPKGLRSIAGRFKSLRL